MPVIGAPPVRRRWIPARPQRQAIEGALTYPSTPLTVRVEVAPGADLTAIPGTWEFQDITSYVLLRDGGITIRVGRAEGATTVEPSALSAQLKNPAGIWTRTNPNSSQFGLLSRNLPIQVSVDPGTGPIVRARQYITSLPPRWDPSGNDKYMPIAAAGVLRRLGQGSPTALSTVATTALALDPIAYWPCGDASGSTSAASVVPGIAPMRAVGATFAGDTGCPGAPSLVSLAAGGYLRGSVPAYTQTTEWSVIFVMRIATPPTTSTELAQVFTTGGSIARWVLFIDPATAPSSDTVYLRGYSAGGGLVVEVSTLLTWDDAAGEPLSIYGDDYVSWRMSVIQVGTSVTCQWGLLNATWGGRSVSSAVDGDEATVASHTIGTVAMVTVGAPGNSTLLVAGEVALHGVLDDVVAGTVFGIPYAHLHDSMMAYRGETATVRAIRVCRENGIPITVDSADGLEYGHVGDGAVLQIFLALLGDSLGSRPAVGPVAVLRDAEAADESMLAEEGFGLRWQQRTSRYYLEPELVLDYAQGHISDIQPADDDRRLLNDWTISRPDGSSARYVDEDSVAAEGRYDTSAQLNLVDDPPLVQHAAWRVHLGTDGGLRYPAITIDLAANPSLIPAWSRCKVGSRLTIANPPPDLPPDMIDQIIEGWTEQIAFNVWRATLVCSPYRPYEVWTLGDARLGRLDTTGSTLTTAIDTDDVALTVASTGAVWNPVSGDWPFDIEIGGERMTVTNVAGSTSPQTLTVTRSVNTVVKAHAAGAAVRAWRTGVLAL